MSLGPQKALPIPWGASSLSEAGLGLWEARMEDIFKAVEDALGLEPGK